MTVDFYDLARHWDTCDATDPTQDPTGSLDELLDEETGRVLCRVCADVGLALEALHERLVREGER